MMALWLIGLASLWLAAWHDWRARSAPNIIWSSALWLAGPFLAWELFTDPMAMAWRLAAAAVAVVVAWILWRGGQLGAGDAKAIMVAGLLMSPVGYLEADAARFIPILDALLACLLIAEIWRRVGRHQGTPFLVALAPLATLTVAVGGLLWWPVVWLADLVQFAVN